MMNLLIVGIISILGQAVLLRELTVAFYGVELIYLLALGIWLVWTACGAIIGKRRLNPSGNWIWTGCILFALFLPIDVAFIRSIRAVFSPTPGAYLPIATQILATAAAILPIGLLSGLIFQWAAKSYITRGATLAKAYGIESIGGLVGGACATLFLGFGWQNLTIALLGSLVALTAIWMESRKITSPCRAITAMASVAIVLLLWQTSAIDRALTRWTHPNLLVSRDTPYGRITITQQGDQIAVYENDALSFETEGTAAEEFAHLAALLHPSPKRVLILGGGIEGVLGEILKHGPTRVDYVELNSTMLHLVESYLPRDLVAPLHAASVRVTIADARHFLVGAGQYDLILIGMPEPASGQANRFYTHEFFIQCAKRLSSDGILAFKLPSSENVWTIQQASRAASIHRALKTAFPHVLVLPGNTNIFAASRQPLTKDPALLAARLATRGIVSRLVSAPYLRYLVANDRFFQIARMLETKTAPANSDIHPICYQYTLLIWLSKFYPDLAVFDPEIITSWSRSHWPAKWILGLALPLLFGASHYRPFMRRTLLMGVAAFIGMALETSMLLYYQVKNGILYQNLGLLLTGFMAGLALGAFAADRWITKRSKIARNLHGIILCLGFTVFCVTVSTAMRSGTAGGLAATTGLLCLDGIFVAAIFAYTTVGAHDSRELVAPIYAADLMGGCLGTLASALLLIPAAGLVTTAAAMAPLALLSILLLPWKQS